jgi:peptidoglycan hydrolase-like protein with peptidoglycan-binding domain
MEIITRKQWGAKAPKGSRNSWGSTIAGVGLHWEGPHMGTPAESKVPAILRSIQSFHMGSRGWSDIAYNYVVDPYGNVYEARGMAAASGAFGDADGNAHYVAICYLGGSGDAFTAAARKSIHDLTAYLRAEHKVGSAVKGHRDFKSTDCPGDVIYAFVKSGLKVAGGGVAKPDPDEAPGGKGIPTFPLPRGAYFGPGDGKPGGGTSGAGSAASRAWLKRWQAQMSHRGWTITADGLYGPQTAEVARRFQSEKGLVVDGLIGPATWRAAWAAPIT